MLNQLINDVNQLKEYQRNVEYNFQSNVNTEFKRRQRVQVQPQDLLGMHTAVVVSTIDPLKEGRVRWFNPLLVEEGTELEALPWAAPISPFGGFDDSGAIWVPPAGSTIAMVFHAGNRNSAYYLGSIWTRKRGSDGEHLSYWGQPIEEYECLHSGRRDGYNFGDNSGDQVLPPWNTEMYNGYDNDSTTDFYNDETQYQNITNPHIFGFKTNQKSGLKFVDGDPKCNYRFRRSEWFTGCGNWIMMKDDHLHPSGQWAYGTDDSLAYCQNDGKPQEFACCDDEKDTSVACSETSCESSNSDCSPSTKKSSTTIKRKVFANPFFKRKEEMRPYNGANNPENNKCALPQSGIQAQTIAGNQFVMDDSVNQPKGVPTWKREFDFGCDNVYKGKIYIKTATGQYIGLHDTENEGEPGIRSKDNGIFLKSATGNFINISDHTVYGNSCECPPGFAGNKRGIEMGTSSTHSFKMIDHRLEQCSPSRMSGGIPKRHDKPGFKGYCLLRSGYGLQLLMSDSDKQTETSQQAIQLLAPQTDNDRGPHMLVMQEAADGPGLVLLRSGGVMYVNAHDHSIEVVGDTDNEAHKITSVTGHNVAVSKGYYINVHDTCLLFAKNYMYLLAGEDCEEEVDEGEDNIAASQAAPGTTSGKTKKGPCAHNALVAKDPWTCPLTNYVHYGILGGDDGKILLDSRSTRVFISGGKPDDDGSEGEG